MLTSILAAVEAAAAHAANKTTIQTRVATRVHGGGRAGIPRGSSQTGRSTAAIATRSGSIAVGAVSVPIRVVTARGIVVAINEGSYTLRVTDRGRVWSLWALAEGGTLRDILSRCNEWRRICMEGRANRLVAGRGIVFTTVSGQLSAVAKSTGRNAAHTGIVVVQVLLSSVVGSCANT